MMTLSPLTAKDLGGKMAGNEWKGAQRVPGHDGGCEVEET